MAERTEYSHSIDLIKEAEGLIRESQNLLMEIKTYVSKEPERDTEALMNAVYELRLRNDGLYMENVLLKSKIQELTMLIEELTEKNPPGDAGRRIIKNFRV